MISHGNRGNSMSMLILCFIMKVPHLISSNKIIKQNTRFQMREHVRIQFSVKEKAYQDNGH